MQVKQYISIILTVIFFGVANGGTIKINATDFGGGKVLIGYEVTSGTALPVGFGLNIQLNNQATFDSVISASTHFPIYPGTIEILEEGSVDYGTPIAPSDSPGALPGLGTSGVTIEMGVEGIPVQVWGFVDPRDFNGDMFIDYMDLSMFVNEWLTEESMADLNGDGVVDFVDYGIFVDMRFDAPPTSLGELLLLQLNGNGTLSTQVTISPENTYRGGIIDSEGNFFNVLLPEPVTVIIPEPATILLLGFGGSALLRKRRR